VAATITRAMALPRTSRRTASIATTVVTLLCRCRASGSYAGRPAPFHSGRPLPEDGASFPM
jgi:hypothetical protein